MKSLHIMPPEQADKQRGIFVWESTVDKFFRLAMTFVAASVALPAAAADETRNYFSAAYEHVFDDTDRASDNGMGLALGYGWALSQRFGLEASAFFHTFDGNPVEWDELGLKLDVLGFFSRNPDFAPYLAAGLGLARNKAELGPLSTSSNDPLFDIGGGFFKYFDGTDLALRADLRYRFIDTDFAPSFAEPVLKVGLVLPFGGGLDGTGRGKKGGDAGKDSGPNRSFENVNFAFDKADLTDYAKAILDNTAGTIKTMSKKYPSLKVDVSGHTDWVGTDGYNQALSERRANVVKSYLMDKGVNLKIDTTAYGESKPVATNETEEGRALNRRAEVRTSAE